MLKMNIYWLSGNNNNILQIEPKCYSDGELEVSMQTFTLSGKDQSAMNKTYFNVIEKGKSEQKSYIKFLNISSLENWYYCALKWFWKSKYFI